MRNDSVNHREILGRYCVGNARPHSAGVTLNLIEQFDWEELDHPPYSPDLVPSDYHLFLSLKHLFGGRHLNSDNDVKNGVL
ncbi:hypothetical protein Trydic_g22476 [Trypoxylus dichotomus]